jgi:hypothetical protein
MKQLALMDLEAAQRECQNLDNAKLLEKISAQRVALEQTKRCNRCCSPGKGGKLLRCSKCKEVVYCSKDCQVKDWSLHKKQCFVK